MTNNNYMAAPLAGTFLFLTALGEMENQEPEMEWLKWLPPRYGERPIGHGFLKANGEPRELHSSHSIKPVHSWVLAKK